MKVDKTSFDDIHKRGIDNYRIYIKGETVYAEERGCCSIKSLLSRIKAFISKHFGPCLGYCFGNYNLRTISENLRNYQFENKSHPLQIDSRILKFNETHSPLIPPLIPRLKKNPLLKTLPSKSHHPASQSSPSSLSPPVQRTLSRRSLPNPPASLTASLGLSQKKDDERRFFDIKQVTLIPPFSSEIVGVKNLIQEVQQDPLRARSDKFEKLQQFHEVRHTDMGPALWQTHCKIAVLMDYWWISFILNKDADEADLRDTANAFNMASETLLICLKRSPTNKLDLKASAPFIEHVIALSDQLVKGYSGLPKSKKVDKIEEDSDSDKEEASPTDSDVKHSSLSKHFQPLANVDTTSREALIISAAELKKKYAEMPGK